VADLLRDSVKRIVVETAWLPPIVIEDPFAPAPPGAPSEKIGRLLKPRVTVETAFGPVVSQPWGTPTQNWPMLRILLPTLGVLSFLAWVARATTKDRLTHERVHKR
jgi:hypothetical protein